MSQASVIFGVTNVVAALPLIFIGYQIGIRQKIHWINGVDFSTLSDPEAFGRFIGHSITGTGITIFALSFLVYAGPPGYMTFFMIAMFVPLVPLFCFFIAKQKYTRRDSK